MAVSDQAHIALCHKVVTEFVETEQLPLPPAGIDALVEAILPIVAQANAVDASQVRRIAHNYYLDGPMVQQMLAGDSAESERLWGEWRGYMVSLGHSKGLSTEQAEDLAQDAYLQAIKALTSFRFGSRLKTYFCGVFLNCYRHWTRSTSRMEMREQALVAESDDDDGMMEERSAFLIDKDAAPETQVLERVFNEQIRDRVHQEITQMIRSEDFQILYLYYVEKTFVESRSKKQLKWTDKAIGERLEMPLNTVTSRRTRVRNQLQKSPLLQELFAEVMAGSA